MSARQIEAGGAFVRLFTKDGELNQGLRRAENRLRQFGQVSQKIGGVMAGTFVAAAAAITPAVRAASNLEEQVNKFNVVFGESRDSVRKWSQEFADGIGRSERQIVQFMASSQDLFVPLGFASDKAEDLSKEITKLSIDLASFNNKSDADVLNDLQAALTGSGEVMKKYGVILSEAAVKQELLNMGLDPKTVDDQAKVQARLNIILRGTTAAQGDAERSGSSYANQMKALEGTVEDIQAELGEALLPILSELAGEVRESAKDFKKWADENPELIRSLAKTLAISGALGAGMFTLGTAARAVAASLALFQKATTASAASLKTFGAALVVAGIAAFANHLDRASQAARRLREELDRADKDKKFQAKIETQFENPEQRRKFLEQELARQEEIAEKMKNVIQSEAEKEQQGGLLTRAGNAVFGGGFDAEPSLEAMRLAQSRAERVRAEINSMEAQQNAQDQAAQEKPQGAGFKIPSALTDRAGAIASAFSPMLSEATRKAKEIQDQQIRSKAGKAALGIAKFLSPGFSSVSNMAEAGAEILGKIPAARAAAQTPEAVQRSVERIAGNQALEAGTGEAQRAIAAALAPRVTIEERSLKVQEEIEEHGQNTETLLTRLVDLFEDNGFQLIRQEA